MSAPQIDELSTSVSQTHLDAVRVLRERRAKGEQLTTTEQLVLALDRRLHELAVVCEASAALAGWALVNATSPLIAPDLYLRTRSVADITATFLRAAGFEISLSTAEELAPLLGEFDPASNRSSSAPGPDAARDPAQEHSAHGHEEGTHPRGEGEAGSASGEELRGEAPTA